MIPSIDFDSKVSPACAGMIPCPLSKLKKADREPRMRGDDPGDAAHEARITA